MAGCWLLFSTAVSAQLRPTADHLPLTIDQQPGADAGANFLTTSPSRLSRSSGLLATVDYGPSTIPAPTPFDFTSTRPHLAFFCRLEINEARGAVIPMKFRLGGHRSWQEDLLR